MDANEEGQNRAAANRSTAGGAGREVIAVLSSVWTSIAVLGQGLTPGQWLLATGCPGWNVQDQVSHLIGTESRLLGRPSPPADAVKAAHVLNALGEANEAWVASRRAEPGEAVLREFRAVTADRLRALLAMSDDDLAVETPSPIGPVPYATFMQVRVMDCWIHEQDMRLALGLRLDMTGPAVATVVERLGLLFPFTVGKRVAPPEGTSVVLALTGPSARTSSVLMAGGRALASPEPAKPTARITTDTGTFVLVAAGRLAAASAIERGGVRFDGDESLGRAVLANLANMP